MWDLCRLSSINSSTVTEYRAHFDADVEFANGGRLTAERFRLDLPSRDLSDEEIAQLFVRHLGLALVGSVQLRSVQIVAEPQKGSRGIAELEKLVDSEEFEVAFSLFHTTIEELMSLADADMIMPPKSTWFEPKLRSGLFVHLLS